MVSHECTSSASTGPITPVCLALGTSPTPSAILQGSNACFRFFYFPISFFSRGMTFLLSALLDFHFRVFRECCCCLSLFFFFFKLKYVWTSLNNLLLFHFLLWDFPTTRGYLMSLLIPAGCFASFHDLRCYEADSLTNVRPSQLSFEVVPPHPFQHTFQFHKKEKDF
jgi:hypothetical protein